MQFARITPTTIGLVCACAALAGAVEPKLEWLEPYGGQRGTQIEVEFRGERLADARSVLVYEPGIVPDQVQVVDERTVRARLTIAPDCRLGLHALRMVTATGITEIGPFHVSPFPRREEAEPNDDPAKPEVVKLNTTIDGRLTENDVDCYAFDLTAGQEFSAELDGIRLGSMVEYRGGIIIDGVLTLIDSEGAVVAQADDGSFAGRDPVLTTIVPRSGRYVLKVHDAVSAGGPQNIYRLHVGDFSRPTCLYPAGGEIGKRHSVRAIGAARDGSKIHVDAAQPIFGEQAVFPVNAPSANVFRPSSAVSVNESEPNDSIDEADRGPTSDDAAFNGIIERPGDVDSFTFTLNTSGAFNIRVYAKKLGSPLDTYAAVLDRKGRVLIEANDSAFMDDLDGDSTDTFLRFGGNAGETYTLQVRGHLGTGGPTCVYRAELSKAVPWLALYLREYFQYSQQRLVVTVPRGNRYLGMLGVRRGNIDGPLTLSHGTLPPGVRCDLPAVAGSVDAVPVVFEAAEDARLGTSMSTLEAALETDPAVRGKYAQTITLSIGFPAYTPYRQYTTDKLVLAVVERAPFRVDVLEPEAPLVPGGSATLQVRIDRDAGFDERVEVQLPFKPPGCGAYPSIQIPPGETRGEYVVTADANAEVGTWPLGVMATAKVDGGNCWIGSNLIRLPIVKPYVAGTMSLTAAPRGTRASMVCKLEQLKPFDGTAKARLRGLPPGVKSDVLELSAETQSLTFELDVDRATPLGRFDQVSCEIDIPLDGRTIVHQAAVGSVLRIDPECEADAAKPIVAASRLEQLRQEYAEWLKTRR